MTSELAVYQIVAVEVGALFIAVPDHLAVPLFPRAVDGLGPVDTIDARTFFELNSVADQRRTIKLPKVVRRLEIEVLGLERKLDEIPVELDGFVQQLGRQLQEACFEKRGEERFRFPVEAGELVLDAQLDEYVFVGRPINIEPLRRVAVFRPAVLDIARFFDEELLDL